MILMVKLAAKLRFFKQFLFNMAEKILTFNCYFLHSHIGSRTRA